MSLVALRIQDEHFKILFPGHDAEVVLFVFRATWCPSDSHSRQLPGRCFVTEDSFCFYSHHKGLVFTNTTPLFEIQEATAAPGQDCDYVLLRLRPDENTAERAPSVLITLKTVREPLRLLQRRLDLLIRNANYDKYDAVELSASQLLPKLLEIEKEEDKAADPESWEDLGLHIDGMNDVMQWREGAEGVKSRPDPEKSALTKIIDDKVKKAARFKLPANPVEYEPEGMMRKSHEREFDISPQALFHVMFGNLSPLCQALYAQRQAQDVQQGHWTETEEMPKKLRRTFSYRVNFFDFLGRSRRADVVDHQTVEKQQEYLCYVVRDCKTPWHLPHRQDFTLITTYVITHLSPGKCKLSIWTDVKWTREHRFSKGVITAQALEDLDVDALDICDVLLDLIRPLGTRSQTKKALQTFGPIGGPLLPPTPADQATAEPIPIPKLARQAITQRSLTRMLSETSISFLESAVSSIVMGIFAALAKTVSVITGNRVLVAVIAVLMVLNISLASRSTVSFFTERRANSLLRDLNVQPDGIMARAVQLRDIDDIIYNGTTLIQHSEGSPCFARFAQEAELGVGRSRNARLGLAAKRNQLLVAFRLLNRWERELVRSEWEEWVLGEDEKCGRVGGEVMERVGGAIEEYCGSCRREVEVVRSGDW